jgi:hypothetical protein
VRLKTGVDGGDVRGCRAAAGGDLGGNPESVNK